LVLIRLFDILVNLYIGILGLLVNKLVNVQKVLWKNRKWILRPRKFIILFVFLPLWAVKTIWVFFHNTYDSLFTSKPRIPIEMSI